MKPAKPQAQLEPLKVFLKAISGDVSAIRKQLEIEHSQLLRRAFIRSVFATIEAYIHRLKQLCLAEAAAHPSRYSTAELAILGEETFTLNEKGEPVSTQRFVPLPQNLLFALQIRLKGRRTKFVIDTSGQGWRDFKRSVGIRNRLMHPKSSADYKISDEEFRLVDASYVWFLEWAVIQSDLLAKELKEDADRFTELQKHRGGRGA
jgi:hypothetical protein